MHTISEEEWSYFQKDIFGMGGLGVGNGGKSDLFGNTSAAVDFYKFRWDPMNTETLLFVNYQDKLVEEVANVHVFKNGHILPTGQWYAPSAVIKHA